MTTLFYVDPELAIGLNRTIIFVNPNDNQIFKDIELPEYLNLDESYDYKKDDGQTESEKLEKPKTAPTEPVKIQQVSYSPDKQLIAVTTSVQKFLLLYSCRFEHAWLVSVRRLSRTSNALVFSSDSGSVLVIDKTGDCYLYDCVDMKAPPKLILGHLSIVYDVVWTENKKYIITCDRDDKIRVTNFPNTSDIHGYCLGHKEFVSGLKHLSKTSIASISGDKTLRIWDYECCTELKKIELPGAAIRFDVRRITDSTYEVAILHPLDDCVSMYLLEESQSHEWNSKELGVYKLEGFNAHNICLTDGRLYVSGAVNEKFAFKLMPIPSAVPPPDKWLHMIDELFNKYNWVVEDVSSWFKKHYDNVSDYLERKKRRIEDKKK